MDGTILARLGSAFRLQCRHRVHCRWPAVGLRHRTRSLRRLSRLSQGLGVPCPTATSDGHSHRSTASPDTLAIAAPTARRSTGDPRTAVLDPKHRADHYPRSTRRPTKTSGQLEWHQPQPVHDLMDYGYSRAVDLVTAAVAVPEERHGDIGSSTLVTRVMPLAPLEQRSSRCRCLSRRHGSPRTGLDLVGSRRHVERRHFEVHRLTQRNALHVHS